MGRRYQAELFEGEYEADERTRAVVPSSPGSSRSSRVHRTPSYDDQFEDRTRSARESQVALGGLARASFVAPAEIEGERSPAIRARRQSFVDTGERPVSRHSYVASSERNDFATSADDDEVTNYREDPRLAVRESTYAPAIESAEIEEVAPRPVDYEALKRYLFDEIPASPSPGAYGEERASMETPVAPIHGPRGTSKAFRPAMHSIRPEMLPPGMSGTPAPVRGEVHPAARISHHAIQSPAAADARASHHAFRPPMTTGPFLPPSPPMSARPQMHAASTPSDAHANGSWIVPTPRYPMTMPPLREPDAAGFKVTLSFLAAAITAALALAVMIGAIVFIRSEDAPEPGRAPTAALPVFTADVAAPSPELVAAAPVVAASPTAPVAQPQPAVVVRDKPVVAVAAVVNKPAVAKKKPVVLAQADDEDEDEAPPPPPKKKASSAKDKEVERMLAELQEQQLQR